MMRALRVLGLVAVATALALVGWRLMCTTFMIHDDEGYVLISLRNFSEHGRLYDGVFTQYGPVPFLYYDALHRLFDVPIGSLLGRVVTTVHWAGAAPAAGLIAWRLSGRYWTAVVTLAAAFGYLWQMTWEPVHPGGLIAVIAAAALALALDAWRRGQLRCALGVLGAVGAVLFFIKINVGLLWCCSLGAFLLLESDGWLRGRGAWLAAAGFVILPFGLMYPLLGEPWIWKLAVVFALSGAALCLPFNAAHEPTLRPRDWLIPAAAFAGVGMVICAATLTHGTSLSALWNGVVLEPLRHPVNFHLGTTWRNSTWVAEALALTACGLWCLRPDLRPALRDVVAGLRLLTLGAFIWRLQAWISVEGLGELIRHGLPLLPLFLLPLAETTPGEGIWSGRRLVALIGLGQILHAYPVAGSQMAWGSFLLLPSLINGVVEAANHVAARLQRAWLPAAVSGLALLATGAQAWWLFDEAGQRWRISAPLNVPGAEFLRPQENVRYALRIVTANARLHADMLFSRPGMFGFNLWSGVPTPTLRNTTHWFWQLSAEEQQAIIARLRTAVRPAVISSRPVIDLLRNEMGVTVTGPLNDYINAGYRPLFTVTGYEFLVPKGSPAVPFFVAQNFLQQDGATDEPAMLAVNVAANAEVARIILRDFRAPERTLVAWEKGNSQVTLQSIDANGRPQDEAHVVAWPVRFDGLQQMRLYHRSPLPADRPELELLFLDAAGQIICEACYDPAAIVSLPPAKD